ncbi:MAG: hypothetical protein ACRCSP_01940 [Rhodoglobus sp.]
MTDSFDREEIAAMLAALLGDRGSIQVSEHKDSFLLTSNRGRSPITVVVDGDTVRIRAGSLVFVGIADDIPPHKEIVSEVIGALLNGQAEELYGMTSSGHLGALGWRVWYPNGERAGEVSPGTSAKITRVPLLPW